MKLILPLVLAVAIQTVNVSSVTTGGIEAGGNATATGTRDASAEVHTTIKAGNAGGTVEVNIKTEVDGVVRTEYVKKEITESVTTTPISSVSAATATPPQVFVKVFEWWGGFWSKVQSVFWFF